MEIPVINRMSEFEATLNNPSSLITRLFSIFELAKSSSLPHRLWKWGALFLALLYAFSSLAYKIKRLILHYHTKSKSILASASEPLLLSHFDDDFSSDDDDDNDDVRSSSDDDESEEEVGPSSSYEDLTRFNCDYRVKGSFGNFRLRRRKSVADNLFLSDFVNGNGVVKLWENSILGEIPAAKMSPAVMVSGTGDDGVLGLGLWDLRMCWKSPVAQATWRSNRKSRGVGVDPTGTGKVYVADYVGVAVADVRKVETPLEDVVGRGRVKRRVS